MTQNQEKDVFACIQDSGINLVKFSHCDREQKRINFLEWVHDAYHPHLLLYAGSGFDQIPKRVFGESVVVHLSLEETNRSYTKGYFMYLGDGMKIGANFLQIPLRDSSVDAVYIHDSPYEVTAAAVGEFTRVLHDRGILILDNGDWTMQQVNHYLLAVERYFYDTILPSEFCDPNNTWRRITDTQYNPQTSGCGAIIGYSYTLARAQYLLNYIPSWQRSITAQLFGIFEKR